MKKKTYVLTISKVFLAGHPRAGEPTWFREKILSGEKIHTIRGNFDWWADCAAKVNAGRGVLSLREWTGKPYASRQEEFARLESVGVQDVFLTNFHGGMIEASVDDWYVPLHEVDEIIRHDGLKYSDFHDWFFPSKKTNTFSGCVIHFTDLRY